MASPSFVVIGHVTKDLVDGGYVIGGGATYASHAARALGYDVAVVTRAAADVAARLAEALADAAVVCLPSSETSTFRNVYEAGRREQYLVAVADPITPTDVPADWRFAGIVLMAPVAGEIDDELLALFPDSLLGLAAQGWLRRWGPDGRVHPAPWRGAAAALARADAVVLSDEDVGGDGSLVTLYAGQTRVLALTTGRQGATIYVDGAPTRVPGFPAREVDPTGAGDVFAAAFLIAYHETRDPYAAARFANCAASFAVERPGVASIATREQIAERLRGSYG